MGRIKRGSLVLALAALLAGGCSPGAGDPAAADATAVDAPGDPRVAALKSRRDQVAADRANTEGLRITAHRYRHEREDGTDWMRPYLDIEIQNGTPLWVASFTVLVSLHAPAGGEPLLREELKVPVTEKIGPGNPFEITLTPSRETPWGQLEAPAGSRMDVQIVSLVTPSGDRYLGSGAFDEVDARQLAKLEAEAD